MDDRRSDTLSGRSSAPSGKLSLSPGPSGALVNSMRSVAGSGSSPPSTVVVGTIPISAAPGLARGGMFQVTFGLPSFGTTVPDGTIHWNVTSSMSPVASRMTRLPGLAVAGKAL